MPNPFPRVVVTPLNWGLGHATRCIPIIHQLIALRCEVIIASHGSASLLLASEFPALQHITTPGKTIQYGKTKVGFLFSLLLQIPGLVQQLRKERRWIREFVDQYQPHLIISDNRYGMYHESVPSVLITHQLGIKTGLGRFMDRLLQYFLYPLIKKFNEVWVPDYQGKAALAGSLSHPKKMPSNPVFYVGPLNRFADFGVDAAVSKNRTNNTPELLLLLSGPEPQRSLLENILKKQVAANPGKVTLLRGLPQKVNATNSTKSAGDQLPLYYGTQYVEIIDHLPAEGLFRKIMNADIILCRSGYTSLMELLPLHKKLILVPTPGQTEQEYLATYCSEKRLAICCTQKNLQLKELIQKADSFPFQPLATGEKEANPLIQERVRYYLRSLL